MSDDVLGLCDDCDELRATVQQALRGARPVVSNHFSGRPPTQFVCSQTAVNLAGSRDGTGQFQGVSGWVIVTLNVAKTVKHCAIFNSGRVTAGKL